MKLRSERMFVSTSAAASDVPRHFEMYSARLWPQKRYWSSETLVPDCAGMSTIFLFGRQHGDSTSPIVFEIPS